MLMNPVAMILEIFIWWVVGGWGKTPLKNMSQLGWWQKPNIHGKMKNWWQPNHQAVNKSMFLMLRSHSSSTKNLVPQRFYEISLAQRFFSWFLTWHTGRDEDTHLHILQLLGTSKSWMGFNTRDRLFGLFGDMDVEMAVTIQTICWVMFNRKSHF